MAEAERSEPLDSGRATELHRTEIGLLERGIRLPRLDTIVKVAGGIEIATQFGDDLNGGRRIVTQAKRPCPPTCQ